MKANECQIKKKFSCNLESNITRMLDVIMVSCVFYGNVLSMKSKQKRMMARAPIESLRICSFCISSQFVPM